MGRAAVLSPVRWTTTAPSWHHCTPSQHATRQAALNLSHSTCWSPIRQRRRCECGRTLTNWKVAWRVDAHADVNGVGVGGWWPQANEKGQVETMISPCFAIKVTPEKAPWAFQREGKAYRVIAFLEALSLLLALLAFGPAQERSGTKTVMQVCAFTDNRGNGYVINKLMTTRFPLCATAMKLAAQAEHRGVRMEAQWTPSDRNQEADDLSNL